MAYQSEIILLNSPAPTNGTDTEDLSSGGNIYVGDNVDVIDEGTTNSSTPIYCNGYGSAIIDGFVYGFSALTFAGVAGDPTSIEIGATGNVSNFGANNAAVEVQTGSYSIDNAGTIQAVHYAVDLDYNGLSATGGSGGGVLQNTGVIESAGGVAVTVGDTASADSDVILNYGTISGGINADGKSTLTIDNTGTLDNSGHSVILQPATEAVILHNEGVIDGNVPLSNNGSSLIDSGKIQGDVAVDGPVEVTSTGVISPSNGGPALATVGGSYDFKIAGEVLGDTGLAIKITSSSGAIDNTGTISSSGADAIEDSSGVGFVGDLYNYGTISGPGSGAGDYDAVNEGGGHTESIFNYGAIDGGADGQTGSAVFGDSNTVINLSNSGKIAGAISFYDGASTLYDSGTIDGGVYGLGDVVITSAGVIATDNSYGLEVSESYDIKNAGEIAAASFGIAILNSPGSVVNTGSISAAGDGIDDLSGAGDIGFIYNYGTISGAGTTATIGDAIHEVGGHTETIYNTGVIEGGGNATHGSAIYADSTTVVSLHNSGEIEGQVGLGAEGSYIDNAGHIEGFVMLAGEPTTASAATDFVNSAKGVVSSDSAHSALTVTTGAFNILNQGDILAASSGSSSAAGVALDASGGAAGEITNSGSISGDGYGVEDLATSGVADLNNSGTISALNGDAVADGGGTTGHAVEIYNSGTISSPAVAIYASTLDKEDLHNHGVVDGKIDLAAPGSSIQNWGKLSGSVVFGGTGADLVNDGIIDGAVSFTGNGNVFNGALGDVTGVVNGAGATSIYIAGLDNETFNLDAGAGSVRGGAGSDIFEFDVATLTAATTIVGGTGADTVSFSNAGTIAAGAFAHVSGIAAITLANGTNNLTIGNALANSANGGMLTINGGTGADDINVAGVSAATDHVKIYGGGGADAVSAGAAVDTFGYHAVGDSTGTGYDTISGVNFAHDYFDVSAAAGLIGAVNPAVTTGALSTGASFNTELAAAIGASQLGAHDAVLFTPNSGTLAGDTFLIVDSNGVAGYQANADLVIRLASFTGTLGAANFM